MTEQPRDWISAGVAHDKELAERRAAWERQQQAEAEEAERQQKQAALERYLRRRGYEYQDTTGAQPPREVLERWQEEFVDEAVAAQERAHSERLA